MEAGPRDTAQGTGNRTPERDERKPDDAFPRSDAFPAEADGSPRLIDGIPRPGGRDNAPSGPRDAQPDDDGLLDPADAFEEPAGGGLTPDGPDEADETPDGVTDDGPEPEEMFASGPEVEVELRPQRRLRIWQLAPIVALATVGSLMFAFPLAFDFGDSGAVVAMLGLLICSCAAGWGMMAARRVGHTWPGLPLRGSGRRPDWRVVLAYAVMVAAAVVLAVWRVARLR
ncbi:hypothetical protein [Streptomyces sp. 4F14]|uniref:hypothetical protein n=1 Tax=Streptomyces sp. 4F14 TaxID=3394380 RepID=UPI003A85D8C5